MVAHVHVYSYQGVPQNPKQREEMRFLTAPRSLAPIANDHEIVHHVDKVAHLLVYQAAPPAPSRRWVWCRPS